MVTFISRHIISKSLSNNPVIELLIKQKLFDFDEPSNIAQIACELHLVIPKNFSDDPVLKLLGKHGLFDFNAEKNTIYLPIHLPVAKLLGMSLYSDRPMDSYLKGISDALKRFRDSSDFALAQTADNFALKRLESAVCQFQAKVAEGLATGRVFIAAPLR